MSNNPGEELVPFSEAEAAVESYRAGGLIEAAISAPEGSMDRIIGGHLANVAMLEARGDISPERPAYVFNPESRLLINYALRRNRDPRKSGLFADVVELDESGKPRHGVSVVNPFATSTGFINVSVGDNPYGFAPSHTEMRLYSDDPLLTVPPNIETADLLSMIGQSAITEDESVKDFVHRRIQEREGFREKVRKQQKRHYLGTIQSFDELTNPDMHLIISDRDDPSQLAVASREVGLYPLVVSGEDVLDHYRMVKSVRGAPADIGETVVALLRHTHPELFSWLETNSVAFATIDLPLDKQFDDSPRGRVMTQIPHITYDEQDNEVVRQLEVERSANLHQILQNIVHGSPIFARLFNPMLHQEYSEDGLVEKTAHGDYLQEPIGVDPENIKQYTDWLRKVRLDMALTLYLRGLNQL